MPYGVEELQSGIRYLTEAGEAGRRSLDGVVGPLDLWATAGELADIAGLPVDLLDLRAASTVMQYQVIMKGQCLWSAGVGVGIYEAFILSEKTNLDTARAGLLSDIYKEGLVHGR